MFIEIYLALLALAFISMPLFHEFYTKRLGLDKGGKFTLVCIEIMIFLPHLMFFVK